MNDQALAGPGLAAALRAADSEGHPPPDDLAAAAADAEPQEEPEEAPDPASSEAAARAAVDQDPSLASQPSEQVVGVPQEVHSGLGQFE